MPDNPVVTVAIVLATLTVVWAGSRAIGKRWGRRALLKFRARVDRYKLTQKKHIVATLLADPEIALAVRAHVQEQGTTEAATWKRVRAYLDEIVPFFSVLAYYKFGYALSKALLGIFYKVSISWERPDPFRGLPRNSIVIYLINHRSNADYVLVAYALAGDVSLSYAVGEWARAFPLEYLFKSFGSYFIRRKYRENLYHTVLARYVQLITRNGVTQGIFPEGGLTRDGTLRPAKIGLLDYALGVARDPAYRARMYVVPVGINYDRVLEDRTLLLELATREGRPRPRRLAQLSDVVRYAAFNTGRVLSGRFKRYGRAAVTIGTPQSVDEWVSRLEAGGVKPLELPRAERLPYVQQLCDTAMERIGSLVPVTPVPLACAALQTFDADFVTRTQLVDRMDEIRRGLSAVSAAHFQEERSTEELLDRAYRMLRMRRVLARQGAGFVILPRGRPLISYYANSVSHLLGQFTEGIRARDSLPAMTLLDLD